MTKCCSGLCIDLLHQVSKRSFEVINIYSIRLLDDCWNCCQFERDLGFTYELTRVEDPKFGTFEVLKHFYDYKFFLITKQSFMFRSQKYDVSFLYIANITKIMVAIIMVMSPSDGLLERVDGVSGQQTDRYGPFCIKGRLAFQICCFRWVCWKGRLLWANRFRRKYLKRSLLSISL